MCNLLNIVYCFLLIIVIADCYGMPEKPSLKQDVKIAKHYQQHKAKPTLNDEGWKKNIDNKESNSDSTEEVTDKTEENEEQDPTTYDRIGNLEELSTTNITEEVGRTGEISKTVFVGSLAETVNHESYDEYDYYESDVEIEDDRKSDDFINEGRPNTDTGEVLVHTPTLKILSQDAVLDLKARTGHFDEDDDSKSDSNQSDTTKIGHLSHHSSNENLRTGLIPSEEVEYDNISPVHYTENKVIPLQKDTFPLRWTNPPRINHGRQLNWPIQGLPANSYNSYTNARPKFSPLLFENISSREVLFPVLGSREHMPGQSNIGSQLTSTYFGLNYANNQPYSNRCATCSQSRFPLQERHFRRAAENAKYLQTANGRSVEFDPLGSNTYPLALENNADEPEEANRAHISQNSRNNTNILKTQEVYAPQEMQIGSGLLSKVLLGIPPYISRNNALLRRVALGGIAKFGF